MTSTTLLRISAAALLGLVLATPAFGDIRIAIIGPMTGPYQSLGKQIRDGVERAVSDLNARGGIGGERIMVDVEDDACKAEAAAAAANRAAGRGDVLVVGHVCYEAAKAAAAVYAANRIIAITPAVTADSFTNERAGPTIFRLAARDDAQGATAGDYLARRFGGSRIAILDDQSPYAKPIADAAAKSLNEAGKREARRETFDPGAKDYAELARRLVDDAIDVVFIAGYPDDIALIVQALRYRKPEIVIMGPDSIATGAFTSAAGDAANGTLVTFFTDWRGAESARDVVAAFRAAGVEPVGFTLPAYAAVEAWAAARADETGSDPAAVIRRIQDDVVPTVLGPTDFGDGGSAQLPWFTVYRWQDGILVPADAN